MIETLLAEPHSDVEGSGSVMAKDDRGTVGIELLQAGGDVAHGNLGCSRDGGYLDLPRLAHIEQQRCAA